uniref:Trafficking protein particle complex subunit 13 N-terminal domain-containing protein n=1 Tax=Timema shepardi TaxID=629360 RepID=A0A7R9AVE1_TIMSH|nr:unnamed protein product [Timema shepardi]
MGLKVLVVGTGMDGYRLVRIFVDCVKTMIVHSLSERTCIGRPNIGPEFWLPFLYLIAFSNLHRHSMGWSMAVSAIEHKKELVKVLAVALAVAEWGMDGLPLLIPLYTSIESMLKIYSSLMASLVLTDSTQMTSDSQHLVMRLTRPTLSSPLVVTTDSKDLPGNLLNIDLKQDITAVSGAETLTAGQFLLLPQSFGLKIGAHQISSHHSRYSVMVRKGCAKFSPVNTVQKIWISGA